LNSESKIGAKKLVHNPPPKTHKRNLNVESSYTFRYTQCTTLGGEIVKICISFACV
jgi:hypothetical protein